MKKSLVACVLAAAFVSTSPADAALNAYLKLKGQKSGQIQGGVTQKGREGTIMVIAVDHQVKADAAGRRTHAAFTITKEIDKSSPILYRAMTTNELLPEFELQFWTPQLSGMSGVGAERQHYTVKLTNAKISQINFKMLNNKNPELVRFAEYEEISFTYDTITWTWTDGNVGTTDSGFSKL
jgi:type VI secretion system secreted protein Hcp